MDVEAVAGEPFEVAVEQYGGSGYLWAVDSLPDGMRLLDGPGGHAAADAAPGTPQVRRFRFVAEGRGEFRIRLVAKRPWEADPIDVKPIRVSVRAPGGEA